jgi:hypothetical protein
MVTSPQTVLDTLKAVRANGAFVVPSLLEAWVHDPAIVDYLKTLSILVRWVIPIDVATRLISFRSQVYGGGPLSTSVGDALVARGCHLTPAYGGTEFGIITRIHSALKRKIPEEWSWIELYPNVNPKWRPEGDGTFELQLLPCDTYVLSVENMEDERGYATKDLFAPHPTKEGLWKM